MRHSRPGHQRGHGSGPADGPSQRAPMGPPAVAQHVTGLHSLPAGSSHLHKDCGRGLFLCLVGLSSTTGARTPWRPRTRLGPAGGVCFRPGVRDCRPEPTPGEGEGAPRGGRLACLCKRSGSPRHQGPPGRAVIGQSQAVLAAGTSLWSRVSSCANRARKNPLLLVLAGCRSRSRSLCAAQGRTSPITTGAHPAARLERPPTVQGRPRLQRARRPFAVLPVIFDGFSPTKV